MTHSLAARYLTARSRLTDAMSRRDDQAGLTTIEWALVTLMVCAFAVTALGVLSSFGTKGISDLISKAFGKGAGL